MTVVQRTRPRRRRRARRRRRINASRTAAAYARPSARQSLALVPYNATSRRARGPIIEEPGEQARALVMRGSTRVPRSLRMSGTPHGHAAQLCANVLRGRSYTSTEVPCANARPFLEVSVVWTARPTMSADGTYAGVVFNPHAMFTDYVESLSYFDATGGADGSASSTMRIPSAYQLTANGTMQPVWSTGADGQNTGTPTGIISVERHIPNGSLVTTSLAGDVRFVGGEITFKSFETWQNTGGQLYYVHNPKGCSLLGHALYGGAVNVSRSYIGVTGASTSNVLSCPYVTAMVPVTQAPVCASVIPHTTEFETLNTGCGEPGIYSGLASGPSLVVSTTMEQLDKFIPDNVETVCHYGWNQAIVYQPATTKAAGVSANCEIQFTMHYHVNVVQQSSTNTGGWSVPYQQQTLNSGISNARAASAIQATYDAVKQARVATPTATFRTSAQPDSLASHLPSILGKVARAAPDIAEEIARLLPEGSTPQRIFAGAATIGHTLFG